MKWVYAKYGKPHRRSFDGGVDVVVNFTGGDTWVPSLKTLHRQGRILTCGATAGFDPKEDLRFIWTFELNIRGSNGWMREDLIALLDLLGSGKLKPIIDRELSLADTERGLPIAGGSRGVWQGHREAMTDNSANEAFGNGCAGDIRSLAVHRVAWPEGGLP